MFAIFSKIRPINRTLGAFSAKFIINSPNKIDFWLTFSLKIDKIKTNKTGRNAE